MHALWLAPLFCFSLLSAFSTTPCYLMSPKKHHTCRIFSPAIQLSQQQVSCVFKTNAHQMASQQPGTLARLYKTTAYVGIVVDVDFVSESDYCQSHMLCRDRDGREEQRQITDGIVPSWTDKTQLKIWNAKNWLRNTLGCRQPKSGLGVWNADVAAKDTWFYS